jgi:hypothetical protein
MDSEKLVSTVGFIKAMVDRNLRGRMRDEIKIELDEITASLSRLAEYEALRPDVLTFAKAMEAVLRKHDDRPGWERESYEYLVLRMKQEIHEFLCAESAGDAVQMKAEAVDVANFCMMLFCNIERDEAEAAAAIEKGEWK